MPGKMIGRGACGTCLEIRKLHRNPRGPIAQCRRCLRRAHRKERKFWQKAAAGTQRALCFAKRFLKQRKEGGSMDDILPK
jgi:hypothetical protein